MINIGILGTGNIAHKMADTISRMNGVKLCAVASRSYEKADKFAKEYSLRVAYGSYEELARDGNIDLIYVATPHSRHFEDCMICLQNGRNVLCEKPMTANASQAKKLFGYAESKGLFITEAIWTRYMPMRFKLDEIISSGVIGNISSLTANLGYSIAHVKRLNDPALAGGALLDLGVYTLNFAVMAFGKKITDIRSACVKNDLGVDMQNSIILTFDGTKTAVLHSNAAAATDRLGIIYGDKGRIEFKNINNCEGIDVITNDGHTTCYETPKQISGYEYEVEASARAILAGECECPEMPHSETIFIMRLMDSLRKEWGIVFPFE